MSSITSEQQQYIESLEWDSDYWDNLDVEVIDSLAPEVRELCFEYYDSLVAEPVRDDVKLNNVLPQEVVSEPQEDIVSSTTTEDIMNTNTLIPNWEASGYVSVLALDFSTAITYAYVPEVIPDFWEEAVETEPVVNDLVIKPVVQLCLPASDFTELDIVRTGSKPYFPEVVEFTPLPQRPSIMNIGRGKVGFPRILTHQELADAKAKIEASCLKAERRSAYNSPTITTKSGNVVKVSPHVVTPHGNAPTSNSITNPKVTGSIGEAMNPTQLNVFQAPEYTVQVVDCKTELLEADSFDDIIIITRKYNTVNKQIVLDAKASMTKRQLGYIEGLKKAYRIIKESETVKTKATPVVSTPTPITHNQMMSTIRRMNGGRIPNAPVLNKLVTGYVTRNNAIVASVSKYIAPTLLEIVEKAYAQLTA